MAGLQGIPVSDPNPGTYRQIVPAQGDSLGGPTAESLLLFGNQTSSGSETVETIGVAIASDQDCIARWGGRSEIYQEFRSAREVSPNMTIYAIGVAEGGGAAASTMTLTFATTATAPTQCTITWAGYSVSFGVATGDTATVQGDNAAAAINSAMGGTWPFTAVDVTGTVTLTTANKGPRSQYFLGAKTIKVVYDANVGSTCTLSSVTAGTTEDSMTLALAAVAAAGTYTHQVNPKYQPTASGLSASDHGIGEHVSNIVVQDQPVNGRGQFVYFGLVGTTAQGITVTTASAVDAFRAHFLHENASPWHPCMLAAQLAAIKLLGFQIHPSFNFTGWPSVPGQTGLQFTVPAPYLKSDWLTAANKTSDLNNGITPIARTQTGNGSIWRDITSYSFLPGTVLSDYRVREGHIMHAVDSAWEAFFSRWAAERQMFTANSLPQGQRPLPGVTYQKQIVDIWADVIDDFTGGNPLGLYTGPILDPDEADYMKASISVSSVPQGNQVAVDLRAVKHDNKLYQTIYETSSPQ